MRRTSAILSTLVLLLGLAQLAPARAQVMPSQGIDIPWFRSTSERAQREACRRNLPECRATVRAQMAVEQSITVILPWAGLGVAILGVLFWLRIQEKKRERQKQLARMHHAAGAYKKADKPQKTGSRDDDEEAERLRF
jgi:hypothetical protein